MYPGARVAEDVRGGGEVAHERRTVPIHPLAAQALDQGGPARRDHPAERLEAGRLALRRRGLGLDERREHVEVVQVAEQGLEVREAPHERRGAAEGPPRRLEHVPGVLHREARRVESLRSVRGAECLDLGSEPAGVLGEQRAERLAERGRGRGLACEPPPERAGGVPERRRELPATRRPPAPALPAESALQAGDARALGRRQLGREPGHERQQHLRVPTGVGRPGEVAQPAAILAAHVREPRPVGPEGHAGTPQRDAEGVQRLGVVALERGGGRAELPTDDTGDRFRDRALRHGFLAGHAGG